MHEHSNISAGVRAGLPLLLPTLALGVSFGVLARPVMGPAAPIAMSILVFSARPSSPPSASSPPAAARSPPSRPGCS